MDEPDAIQDEATALAWLLRAVGEEPTGDREADRELGLQATMRVRELNSVAGHIMIDASSKTRGGHLSWRDIEIVMGGPEKITVRTIRRWAEPPS